MDWRRFPVGMRSLFQWRPNYEWAATKKPRTRRTLRAVEALESRVVLASTTITLPSAGVFELSLSSDGSEAIITQFENGQAVAEVARLSGQNASELQVISAGGSPTQFVDRLPYSNRIVRHVQFVGSRTTSDEIFVLSNNPDELFKVKVNGADSGRVTTRRHTLQFRSVKHVVGPEGHRVNFLTLTSGNDRAILSDIVTTETDPTRLDDGESEFVRLQTTSGFNLDLGKTASDSIQIRGLGGNDFIDASSTSHRVDVRGGVGDDTLIGSTSNDYLYGNVGNDSLIGAAGKDNLRGGAGSDTLHSGDGDTADVLSGDGGNDLFDTGAARALVQIFVAGNATVVGSVVTGQGSDRIVGQRPDIQIFGSDVHQLIDASQSDFPVELSGRDGDDTLIGSRFGDELYGGEGHDILEGRTGDDTLSGFGGNDLLRAGTGNDLLRGSNGFDTLDGGTGQSQAELWYSGSLSVIGNTFSGATEGVLMGNFVKLKINGSSGNDYFDGTQATVPLEVYSLDGDDTLLGSPMNDTLNGGRGNDVIRAGHGNDQADGNEGNDLLFGDLGNDGLSGGEGDDQLFGEQGNDRLSGADGNDSLEGHEGDDALHGDAGDDQLWGHDGADTLGGGVGRDALDGGDGQNAIVEIMRTATSLVLTNQTLAIGEEESLVGEFTSANILGSNSGCYFDTRGFSGSVSLYTGTGNDTVLLGSGDDLMWLGFGSGGTDSIDPGAGSFSFALGVSRSIVIETDKVIVDDLEVPLILTPTQFVLTGHIREIHQGDEVQSIPVPQLFDATRSPAPVKIDARSGDDTIYGSAFVDTIDAGTGNDLVFGNAGNDSLSTGEGDDSVDGGEGNDTILAGDGDDVVSGQSGQDVIDAGLGNDRAMGNDGSDTLVGGDGNDTLVGGALNDVLLGEDGDDRLVGQGGSNDTVVGGLGNDTLVADPSEIDETFTIDLSLVLSR